MGNSNAKLLKKNLNDLTDLELNKIIDYCIDVHNTEKLFLYIDQINTRKQRNVPLPNNISCMFLLDITCSNWKSEEKYEVLSQLLNKYNFNLNEFLIYGNIIIDSVDSGEDYIPIYELFLKYGAEINYYSSEGNGTAIDIIPKTSPLGKYLRSQGCISVDDPDCMVIAKKY